MRFIPNIDHGQDFDRLPRRDPFKRSLLAFTTPAYPVEDSQSGTPTTPQASSSVAIGPPPSESAVSTLDWDSGTGKSYVIPAVEILDT